MFPRDIAYSANPERVRNAHFGSKFLAPSPAGRFARCRTLAFKESRTAIRVSPECCVSSQALTWSVVCQAHRGEGDRS